MKTVLHVGCGLGNRRNLHESLRGEDWREIRLDIDPVVRPDILASMHSMPMVESESVDAVWSSHNLEHLASHEVPQALREFHRVLKSDGFAMMVVPDLMQVAEAIIKTGLEAPAYVGYAGPIAPIDMLYGHREWVAHGNQFQTHRTGFTKSSLERALWAAGFMSVRVAPGFFDLWGVATKSLDSFNLRLAAQG